MMKTFTLFLSIGFLFYLLVYFIFLLHLYIHEYLYYITRHGCSDIFNNQKGIENTNSRMNLLFFIFTFHNELLIRQQNREFSSIIFFMICSLYIQKKSYYFILYSINGFSQMNPWYSQFLKYIYSFVIDLVMPLFSVSVRACEVCVLISLLLFFLFWPLFCFNWVDIRWIITNTWRIRAKTILTT